MPMIDATKWGEFYQEMTKDLKPYDHYDDGYRDAMDNVDDWMNCNQVEAEPVRHGRWEDKPNPQWGAYDIRYCSACGWSIHKTKLRKSDLNWEYCPNCGTLMDLEGE